MKPNPVKKTVEYCSSGTGFCSCYERNNEHGYGHCKKYNRDLTQPYYMDEHRPLWCTDETFVRVKIEPFIKEGKEYCFVGMCKCSALVQTGATGAQCMVSGESLSLHNDYWERPDECRKLEVE